MNRSLLALLVNRYKRAENVEMWQERGNNIGQATRLRLTSFPGSSLWERGFPVHAAGMTSSVRHQSTDARVNGFYLCSRRSCTRAAE